MYPKVVLNEERRVPTVGIRRHGCVLRDRARDPDKKVGKRISRRCIVKGKDAVVIQESFLNVLVERQLAADLDRMAALVPTEYIPDGIQIRTGPRSTDRVGQRKIAGDIYLR